jgi:hypothetical protein
MSIHSTDCKHGTDTYEYHCTECCAEEIRNLEMELDSLKNPAYCEKCGSCGEEGCCSPGKCKTVQGLYCDSNVKSWEDMNNEVDKYYQLKDKLKEYLSLASCDGRPIRKQLRKELQELIDE